MKKVVIIQRITGNYRIPFYERITEILQQNDIQLEILYGQPEPGEKNIGTLNSKCITPIKNYYIKIKSKYLVFQFPIKSILNSNLIILQQGNRIITNFFYLIAIPVFNKKVAIWGNCKQELNAFNNNSFKPGYLWKLMSRSDHWFAYNDLTKKIIQSTGYDAAKITSVYNSIDTKSEQHIYDSILPDEIAKIKSTYNITEKDIVGLFCSRLYKDKRIDFLLKTIENVKIAIPNFKFFVIGDGTEAKVIREFATKNNTWFFHLGSKYGTEKILYFKISDFQLLPGAVGLHIVDSFALETPIITTKSTTHGVEIDYLINLENGIICEDTLKSYSETVIRVCQDNDLISYLKKGCQESSKKYTIENMAQRFASGILKTLNHE